MNYKVSRQLIFKLHKRFQESRESLEDDRRSYRPVNMRWCNLAESLMDACINKGAGKHHEMEITSDVFRQLCLMSI